MPTERRTRSISAERLREALRLRGYWNGKAESWRTRAFAARVEKQHGPRVAPTASGVNRMLGGGQKRTNCDRLEAMAKTLHIPARILSGEDDYERLPPVLGAEPSRIRLAEAELQREAQRALRRKKPGIDNFEAAAWALRLSRLVNPFFWRRQLMINPSQTLSTNAIKGLEVASVALADAWREILRPWLSGDTELDWGNLLWVTAKPDERNERLRARPGMLVVGLGRAPPGRKQELTRKGGGKRAGRVKR